MVDILVVTGARAAAASAPAEAWARGAIAEAFDTHHPAKLVTGDAHGPDDYARREAVKRRVPFYCYAGSGKITGADAREWGRWTQDLPPEPMTNRAEWAAWFLHRDRVMVRHVVRRVREGATALVLAIYAPWSVTEGTAFTVGRAKAHALDVLELTIPKGFAPHRTEARHG
jgi:hypothetical protein